MGVPEPRWRFTLLTATLWAWMFVAPHVAERWGVQLLMQLFLIHVVVVTLWTNPRWGVMRKVLLGFWALSFVSAVSTLLPMGDDSNRLARAGQCVALVPLLTLLASGALRYVFTRRQLDADGIFATVAAYLLIAIIFSQVYTLLLIWDPTSFSAAVPLAQRSPQQVHADLLYYSLITLATVGYGDVLPVSETARTFAMLEATLGQFYVAVIVAVFVGMYSAQHQRRPE
jgi:voltage-gated potassium channel